MLSDDSSSDSETGRFKGQTKTDEVKSSSRKQDSFRSGRSRPSENDRFRRDFGRKRDEYDKHSRDRHRFSRHSPVRRRHSRDRSPRRRSNERPRHRATSKTLDRRSASRDRQKRSRSHKSPEIRSRLQKSPEPKPRSHKSPEIKIRSHRSPEAKSERPSEPRRDFKEEIKRTLEPSKRNSPKTERKSPKSDRESPPKTKYERHSREKVSSSPEYKGKKSEIFIPPVTAPIKRKTSPAVVEVHSDSDKSEEVQLGSYYNMIPAVVKEKPEVSSEIDSSDDERLRAKLLNLEKELQKTRKKKHRKKHKRKNSKASKDRDVEVPVVEVSSTTDIQDKVKEESSQSQAEAVPEVSSTQKGTKKESSEEGEISSDDDDSKIEYDASDLRHKLRLSKNVTPKTDVCGPALPPHLQKRRRSSSQDIEGPALPPHLDGKPKSKHLGPSIPEGLRKVLADREVVKYESSDEGSGIGPLPVGAEEKWSEAHQRLEERALDIKIKSIDGRSIDSQKVKNREEWMLELPEGKAKYIGLEARSFRAKEGPDMSDRSSWTDTPEEKARKAAGIVKEEDPDVVMQRDARNRLIATRDDEQEMAVKKHKKKHKRDESLLEQHQKKIKKKKKKEEKETDGKKERRPFSRDVDLQVNRFDEAQKKSIIKKAQDLNSRFGRGEAKYL